MMTTESELGSNTLAEILSQPRCWEDCFKALDEQDQLGHVLKQFNHQTDWLFIGCGSSYYIAQVAAASWTKLTGLQSRAIPASDVLLYPDSVLSVSRPCQPILISRSGHTSEILKVAEYLKSARNIRTLAISCVRGQPLEKIATATIYVLPADEKSMVMTRSFSSMLLALQSLAAVHSNQSAFTGALRKLPDLAQTAFDPLPARIHEFVESHDFADYVFLGQGPFYGVANEAMLKVKEMSCSYAQCFHTLEFRHGPKSIVSRETLVTFLLSETGYEAEREVLEEVKGLGGVTLAITNLADSPARRAADFLVELNLDVPEYARLAAFIFTGQLLGLMTGVKKGMDPDRPRNLTRAVILNG
jgi:glucosamine--fructose-6-phosphate aminotransferase (isomerizing)